MSGQLLTLQLGTYANFVGAHFWNLQDEAAGVAWAERSGEPTADGDGDASAGGGEDAQDAGVLYREDGRGKVRSSCFCGRSLALFSHTAARADAPLHAAPACRRPARRHGRRELLAGGCGRRARRRALNLGRAVAACPPPRGAQERVLHRFRGGGGCAGGGGGCGDGGGAAARRRRERAAARAAAAAAARRRHRRCAAGARRDVLDGLFEGGAPLALAAPPPAGGRVGRPDLDSLR